MSIVSALTLKTTTFINSFLLGLFLKDLLSVLLKEAIDKGVWLPIAFASSGININPFNKQFTPVIS